MKFVVIIINIVLQDSCSFTHCQTTSFSCTKFYSRCCSTLFNLKIECYIFKNLVLEKK